MIVCTFCSGDPLAVPRTATGVVQIRRLLSLAAWWIDPRGVLHEFGLDLAEEIEVRVWDSNAELRYLVLPERPPGTGIGCREELGWLR